MVFDQCAYGLQLPGHPPGTYCKKRTGLLTSLGALRDVEKRWPGMSEGHCHEYAWGSREVGGKQVKLATAAGAYPPSLCKRWAAILAAYRPQ